MEEKEGPPAVCTQHPSWALYVPVATLAVCLFSGGVPPSETVPFSEILHPLTVLSSDPVISLFPSGSHLSALIPLSWACRPFGAFSVDAQSHILSERSREHEANREGVEGLKETHIT